MNKIIETVFSKRVVMGAVSLIVLGISGKLDEMRQNDTIERLIDSKLAEKLAEIGSMATEVEES